MTAVRVKSAERACCHPGTVNKLVRAKERRSPKRRTEMSYKERRWVLSSTRDVLPYPKMIIWRRTRVENFAKVSHSPGAIMCKGEFWLVVSKTGSEASGNGPATDF